MLDFAGTLHGAQLALPAVVFHQRRGLGFIDLQPVGDGLLVVIGAVQQFTATLVTDAVDPGRRSIDIVHLATVTAGAAPGQALHEHIEFHVDQQPQLQRPANLFQQAVQRLGLADVARETVEDEAFFRVRLAKAFADHAQHDVVGNQLPGIHGGLGLNSQGAAGRHRFTQKIAGGNLGNTIFLDQQFCLGALAATRCPNQYDSHFALRSVCCSAILEKESEKYRTAILNCH